MIHCDMLRDIVIHCDKLWYIVIHCDISYWSIFILQNAQICVFLEYTSPPIQAWHKFVQDIHKFMSELLPWEKIVGRISFAFHVTKSQLFSISSSATVTCQKSRRKIIKLLLSSLSFYARRERFWHKIWMNGLWWLLLCLCTYVHANMVQDTCTKTQKWVSAFV